MKLDNVTDTCSIQEGLQEDHSDLQDNAVGHESLHFAFSGVSEQGQFDAGSNFLTNKCRCFQTQSIRKEQLGKEQLGKHGRLNTEGQSHIRAACYLCVD